MPSEQTVPVMISGPSFVNANLPTEIGQVYPQGRISDLRVGRIVNASDQVELGWKASGTVFDSSLPILFRNLFRKWTKNHVGPPLSQSNPLLRYRHCWVRQINSAIASGVMALLIPAPSHLVLTD